MTVQINRSVDTAGIEGRAGRIITKQNNRFAAGSLRLERFVHGVVGLIADLGEIGLFYTERAVCVLLNRRTFETYGVGSLSNVPPVTSTVAIAVSFVGTRPLLYV